MKTLLHRNRFLASSPPLIALLLLPLLAGLLSAPGVSGAGLKTKAAAAAETVIIKEEIPFEDFVVPNICTGELISETGQITTWTKVTLKPDGGLTVQFHYQFKAVGLGDLGNKYIINQESRVKDISSLATGEDFTFVDKFVQITKGSEDNTWAFLTLRLVIDPDGTLRTDILDLKFDCRG